MTQSEGGGEGQLIFGSIYFWVHMACCSLLCMCCVTCIMNNYGLCPMLARQRECIGSYLKIMLDQSIKQSVYKVDCRQWMLDEAYCTRQSSRDSIRKIFKRLDQISNNGGSLMQKILSRSGIPLNFCKSLHCGEQQRKRLR